MTGVQHIDYEQLAQEALRGIVRKVLMGVAKSGQLPGQHHFYISFNTGATGVAISPRLKERYPEEMTIVLQHRFWGLTVKDDRFEVNLTFNGIEERLVVPFAAIKVFFDPSVPYGLQFEGSDLGADTTQDLAGEPDETFPARQADVRLARRDTADGIPALARPEKKPRAPRKPRAAKPSAKDAGSESSKPRLDAASTEPAGAGKGPRAKSLAKPEQQPEPAANDAKIVHLDKFRKK